MCAHCESVKRRRITHFCVSLRQLVNGDVTLNYRHPGYQKTKHFSRIGRTVSVESKELQWISEVMEVVHEVVSSLYINDYCTCFDVLSYSLVVYNNSTRFLLLT